MLGQFEDDMGRSIEEHALEEASALQDSEYFKVRFASTWVAPSNLVLQRKAAPTYSAVASIAMCAKQEGAEQEVAVNLRRKFDTIPLLRSPQKQYMGMLTKPLKIMQELMLKKDIPRWKLVFKHAGTDTCKAT